MTRKDFEEEVGNALNRLSSSIPAQLIDDIDDDLRFIETCLIHYIQLKYSGVEDNG